MGGAALAELLQPSGTAEAALAGLPHFEAKAKRVIFLFMSGGFSQFESFDPKPRLMERQGENLPDSVRGGRPVA